MKYFNDASTDLVQAWGPGNFLALKFESNANEVLVGLNPSAGSGMQKLDSDMNGVWKITDAEHQVLKVIAKTGDNKVERTFRLNGLVIEGPTVG